MTDSTYVQVPPNSTGVKVGTLERTELHFDTVVGAFHRGDTVTGLTSGATGVVSAVELNTDGLSGRMYLGERNGISYINDEELQVTGVTQATSVIDANSPSDTVAYQRLIISDPRNPNYMQRIDRYGATVNTFSDGDPVFGAFGTLTVGEPVVCRSYNFVYDDKSELFWDDTAGGGAVSFESASGNLLIQTGTASGDKVYRTSNYYHHYFPTVGTEVWITMQIGDSGKTNLRRRWGYFDADDGIFWELDGTTLYAVIRSKVSGSVVERRVAASNFSNDSLDSADADKMQIDYTAPNIFVIDFQYLGAGRVRFAVIDEKGAKIIAHVFENIGNGEASYPYMRQSSLPLRLEQENTGTVVSTSEWRLKCCVVRYTQNIDMGGKKHSHAMAAPKTVTTVGGETLVVAYRPATTYKSVTNRVITKVRQMLLSNIKNTGDGPVLFRVKMAPDSSGFTDSTFAAINAATAGEVATDGTIFPSVPNHRSMIVHANQTFTGTPDIEAGEFQNEVTLGADGTTQPVFFITAECLSGTNADVHIIANYEEIE